MAGSNNKVDASPFKKRSTMVCSGPRRQDRPEIQDSVFKELYQTQLIMPRAAYSETISVTNFAATDIQPYFWLKPQNTFKIKESSSCF